MESVSECRELLDRIARDLECENVSLQSHDRKVDLFFETTKGIIASQSSHQVRVEHALEKLNDTMLSMLKTTNGNGTTQFAKNLDMAMKIILILVGIMAVLTMGPQQFNALIK